MYEATSLLLTSSLLIGRCIKVGKQFGYVRRRSFSRASRPFPIHQAAVGHACTIHKINSRDPRYIPVRVSVRSRCRLLLPGRNYRCYNATCTLQLSPTSTTIVNCNIRCRMSTCMWVSRREFCKTNKWLLMSLLQNDIYDAQI